ncbi:MAG: hypothetical protein FWG29_08585, partial [Treponema sp.]|nr:hypothetical protein [Treponema sp.]
MNDLFFKKIKSRVIFSNRSIILLSLFLMPVLLVHSQWFWSSQKKDALKEYRNGNYEEAIKICKTEIAADPGNLESHVVLCW